MPTDSTLNIDEDLVRLFLSLPLGQAVRGDSVSLSSETPMKPGEIRVVDIRPSIDLQEQVVNTPEVPVSGYIDMDAFVTEV